MTAHRELKVVFVLPHLDVGGIERVVTNIISHLDRRRFAPILILRQRRGALLAALPQGVPVLDLGGAPMRRVPLRLERALRSTAADVVYAGTSAANLAVLCATRLMRRPPPVIVSEHTPPELHLREAKWPLLRRRLSRRLYPYATCVATPVPALGAEIRSLLGLPDLPVETMPNPVLDLAAVRARPLARPDLMRPAGGTVFVSAGRLVRAKGFDVLCRALALLRRDHPQARLIILGEGPERPALAALVERLDLAAAVTLPGAVADPFPFFRHADAFVLSSRREGFGNVLVEAMAVGAPVVACDDLGPRAILEDGAAGLLVPRDSPEALAAALARLIEDRDLRARLAQAGTVRARAFDVRTCVPAFEELFLRTAASRAAH